MTNEQAAQILRDHNTWWGDESDNLTPPPNGPTVLGQAIDVAIKALEKADKWDALYEKIAAFKMHSRKMT